MSFRLGIGYKPRGDQETAIASLVQGLKDGESIIFRPGKSAAIAAHAAIGDWPLAADGK